MDTIKPTVQSGVVAAAVKMQREPKAQPCDIFLLHSDLV